MTTPTPNIREQDAPPPIVTGASSSQGREQDAPPPIPNLRELEAPTTWQYFNPFTEIEIHSGGVLPHWSQGAVWYFITYRLADALPKAVVDKIREQREQWKKVRNLNNLTKEELAEYYKLFSERYEALLDAGNGSCLLRDPQNAQIVTNAFRHFEHQRYDLDEFVVMPNHVHVLVKPLGAHRISDIIHSWKSFTANQINKRMGRIGQLWMHESYDHIVRSDQAMNHIRKYIRDNPIAAFRNVTGASISQVREQDAPTTLP